MSEIQRQQLFFFFPTFCIPKKTAARAASSSWIPLSTAVLVMARLLDCGMKRNASEESSDLNCDTEKLVIRAQTPPDSREH